MLNPDKSEAFSFGSRQRLQRSSLTASMTVACSCIEVCERLKTVSVVLDSVITFDDHINGVIGACNHHIWACLIYGDPVLCTRHAGLIDNQ